ncbi:MAG TPA: phosphatidate cytidylyltransferase [Gaiellaceae bacterium]|jgi:phosphatidate cytidylyltransferase|nr:phosphatidate cytidylyltransferase [Gaiellaceae bacterium]
MSALASRLAVIVAGLPVVVACAWYGGWLLFAASAAAAIVALHELYALARPLRPLVLAGYAGASAALVGAQLGDAEWMLGGFLAVFPLAFGFAAVAATRQSTTVALAATVLGAAWIGLGLAHLILVRRLDDGADAILAVLFSVFAADTVAYVVGRIAGRHRMTPVVSPGKTWEGFIAGAIAGVVVAFFLLYPTDFTGWRSFVVGGALVLAAAVGDLFESLVKRDLGAKDTGRILLGHGGVLDRIDSLLFAAPAAFYVLVAVGPA